MVNYLNPDEVQTASTQRQQQICSEYANASALEAVDIQRLRNTFAGVKTFIRLLMKSINLGARDLQPN